MLLFYKFEGRTGEGITPTDVNILKQLEEYVKAYNDFSSKFTYAITSKTLKITKTTAEQFNALTQEQKLDAITLTSPNNQIMTSLKTLIKKTGNLVGNKGTFTIEGSLTRTTYNVYSNETGQTTEPTLPNNLELFKDVDCSGIEFPTTMTYTLPALQVAK